MTSAVLIFFHGNGVFAVFLLLYDLWYMSLTISTVTQTLCQLGTLFHMVADNYICRDSILSL